MRFLPQLVTLEGAGAPAIAWYCAVAATGGPGQVVLIGRYHPRISVHARVHLKGHIYHVDSLENRGERDRELLVSCHEVYD